VLLPSTLAESFVKSVLDEPATGAFGAGAHTSTHAAACPRRTVSPSTPSASARHSSWAHACYGDRLPVQPAHSSLRVGTQLPCLPAYSQQAAPAPSTTSPLRPACARTAVQPLLHAQAVGGCSRCDIGLRSRVGRRSAALHAGGIIRQVGPRRAGDRRVWSWRSYVNSRSSVSSQNGKPLDPISLCPAQLVGSRVLRRLAARTTCTQLAPRGHAAPMPACVQPAGSSSAKHHFPAPARLRAHGCAAPPTRPSRLLTL
jgi:hypothetical protein